MNINIPQSFNDILSKDQNLNGIINSTLYDFGEILEDNSLFFFPEYTDHGIKHIEAVLASSVNLMTEETIENVVGPKDIAVYILAVILHDLGMHLSLEGFIHLISCNYDEIVEPKFDKISWDSLWKNYISEAKRFSSKQLKAIFGDENVTIRIPNLENRGEISQNDRILIGEFVRRHHPRVAHEIAIKGFPGVNNNVLEFANGLDANLLDLAGLIARSHGLSLRRSLELIEEKHQNAKRTPFNVHAVFLMTVLRLSDYLQIDSTRTSGIVLRIKSLQSPISIREHDTHLSVEYIDDKNQDDPERMYVHTSPKSSKIFVKLEALIKDIQNEFDISWAVLGELYGRYNSNKPLLKYRRIISNLNEPALLQSLQYVPEKISFKANEELLLLLIAPLYGDKPKYGVRELIQNSVDACLEREHLNEQSIDYNGQVNLYLKKIEEEFFFEIVDNGKGMNANEIKEFFLTAGSSYRKSPNWQIDFMNEDGNSLVQRSGKFGIGVLAAFLLGNQITVNTKRYDEDLGIRFSAKIIDSQIELELDSSIPIGTKISIKVPEKTYTLLKDSKSTFKWFWLKKPKVKYWVDDQEMNPYDDRKFRPGESTTLPKKAHEISYEGYNRIIWYYNNSPKLLCNGIKIPVGNLEPTRKNPITRIPNLSIFDNNGNLPISLNRSKLTKQLSFIDILEKDICKDLIAWLILIRSNKDEGVGFYNKKFFNPKKHPCVSKYGSYIFDTFYWGIEGYIPNINFFLSQQITKPVFIPFVSKKILALSKEALNKFWILTKRSWSIESNTDIKYLLTVSYLKKYKEDFTVLLKKEHYEWFFVQNKGKLPKWHSNNLTKIFDGKKLVGVSNNDNSNIDSKYYYYLDANQMSGILSDGFPLQFSKNVAYNFEFFYELLKRYFDKNKIIPYKLKKKKLDFKLAFEELGGYMEKYLI